MCYNNLPCYLQYEEEPVMDIDVASRFYNATGVCSRTDPDCDESSFAVDRVYPQLERTIKPGMKVLDLGCNAGRFVFAADKLGAEAVGIDCAAVPLEHARMIAKRRGSSAKFVEGNYCDLPFESDSFDIALLMHNIVECSYDDIDTMLRQLEVILKPDGLFCLSMPDHFLQHQQNGRSLADYDHATGKVERISYVTDDGEEIPYHGYLWPVFFARFVCSRHLTLVEENVLNGGARWMEFLNKKA
jgi:2-polyprenyl-3-methyl-5-hydroxy-6-metoxy-1,4-benzoquinol methylase